MADGRMLRKKISSSRQLARLVTLVDQRLGAPHGAYAALVFSWCVPHLDKEGRMHGDPLLVKSAVAPLLKEVQEEHVAVYLRAMAELDLVSWYEARGDQWLAFPGFERSQPGLRKDREAASECPSPEEGRPVPLPDAAGPKPESLPLNSGVTPELVPHKRSEVKRSEEKDISRAHASDEPAESVPQKPDTPKRCDLKRLEKAWTDRAGGIMSAPLGDLADLCERAAASPPPPGSKSWPSEPDAFAVAVLDAFAAYRSTCSKAKEPPWQPRKVVEHFGRLQRYVAGIDVPTVAAPPSSGRSPSPPQERTSTVAGTHETSAYLRNTLGIGAPK